MSDEYDKRAAKLCRGCCSAALFRGHPSDTDHSCSAIAAAFRSLAEEERRKGREQATNLDDNAALSTAVDCLRDCITEGPYSRVVIAYDEARAVLEALGHLP